MWEGRVRRLPVYRPGVQMVRLSLTALQWIGFVLVCLRSISVSVIQRGILKMNFDGAMGWVTCGVFCSLAATLSIPIFAKVAYESWKHTQNAASYFGGLALCALVSEIPYDLTMSGKLFDWSTQNPVWGLLLGAVALELLRPWRPRSMAGNILFKALVTFAALAWTLLLRVYAGPLLVLLLALFCFAEKRKSISLLGGILLTLPQFPAPVGMAFVNWYDAEKGGDTEKQFCLLYPLQLAVFGLLGIFLAYSKIT